MISRLKIPKLIRWIFSAGIIFLLLMSALRVALYLYFNQQGNHFPGIFSSFLLGLRFDLRMVSILALLLLLTGSISALDPFKTRWGKRLAIFLVCLAAFLLIFFYTVDFAHYSYLSQRLNASVLNYLSDASISMNMAWQTYPVIRILLLLIVGVWIFRKISRFLIHRIEQQTGVINGRKKIIFGIISFLLFGLAIFGKIGQYPLRWSDAFALGNDYKANLALNPFQSFFSSMKFRHNGFDLKAVKKDFPILAPYYGWTAADSSSLNYKRKFSPHLTRRPAPNIILVICESFSGYKSSMWGNPLNTTPYFKSLCDQGIFFDHCFTPSYGTARGVWAVITGITDVEDASTTSSRNPAAVNQHSIVNDFEGYDKNYFIGGSTSWANIRGLLTNNIKDLHLYEQENYSAPKIDVWGISDKNLFLEANKVLRQKTGPFFAIIQTADNHRPYSIPEEDLKLFHKRNIPEDSLKQFGFESDDEMNAFRYTDFGYQVFMEATSKETYFNNTIFLFIGDHGIPGNAGNMFPKAWTEQRLSSEHVPLLIYSPGIIPARRVSMNCSQVDVLPTLAGLCRIPYTNSSLGRNLLDSSLMPSKSFSFIYDPDQGYTGIVKGDYYYRHQLKTGKTELVPIVSNPSILSEEEKANMRILTESVYETSKYLILNNKKSK
jgi:phosphoglycerol transferase MdoB-like AlkP superfamily enzyme